MKKVLLLFAKVSVDAGMTHPEELTTLLNRAGEDITTTGVLLEDLVYHIDGDSVDVLDGASGISLRAFDGMYFRYWGQASGQAMAAARFCELADIPYVDREVLRTGSYNKMTQYMQLHAADVRVPKTLMGMPAMLVRYYDQFGFSFPLIMKSAIGTRGNDNYLAKDAEQLQEIAEKHVDQPFVMQSFVPNDGDYRVLVIGGEIAGIIHRTAVGDTHLNNTSKGGGAQWVESNALPDDVLEMCKRGADFLRRDIAGVDIVRSLDDGTYYCFEVNRSPQIEHASFEDKKATALAAYLYRLSK